MFPLDSPDIESKNFSLDCDKSMFNHLYCFKYSSNNIKTFKNSVSYFRDRPISNFRYKWYIIQDVKLM